MTSNEVLQSVQEIIQRTKDFVPLLYVIGTKDKQVVLLNSLKGKEPFEKEHIFESTGAMVASGYELGTLTHLYFVSKRTGFSSNDPKETELIHMTLLNVKKNTTTHYVYVIMRGKNGSVSLTLLEDIELNDPWTNDLLLPAFVQGYQKIGQNKN
jgi:hypothetical protein